MSPHAALGKIADREFDRHKNFWTAITIGEVISEVGTRTSEVSVFALNKLRAMQYTADIPQNDVWQLMFLLNQGVILSKEDPWQNHVETQLGGDEEEDVNKPVVISTPQPLNISQSNTTHDDVQNASHLTSDDMPNMQALDMSVEELYNEFDQYTQGVSVFGGGVYPDGGNGGESVGATLSSAMTHEEMLAALGDY